MDCLCDYEPLQLAETHTRTARKSHRCGECNRTIQTGDRYEITTGLFEGEFEAYKTCRKCLDLRNFMQAHVPCFTQVFGVLHEDAMQTARDWAHHTSGLLFGTYRLIIEAKRQPKWEKSK